MSWYIVLTGHSNEMKAKDFFHKMKERSIVNDVYLPLRRDSGKDGCGTTFKLTIPGIIFVNFSQEKAKPYLDFYGQFLEPSDTAYATNYRLFHSFDHRFHALDDRLREARVSDGEFNQMRYVNDMLLGNHEELTLLDDCHSGVFYDFDESKSLVNIIEGPYLGLVGYVRQVHQDGDRKKKDRRLVIKVGKMHLQLSSLRKYKHIVLREPRNSKETKESRIWMHTDNLVGAIQAMGYPDDAPRILRTLINNHPLPEPSKGKGDGVGEGIDLHCILSRLRERNEEDWINILTYYRSMGNRKNAFLKELIPDNTLRPFLTSTAGADIPEGMDYVLVPHADFMEIVTRVDLTELFDARATAKGRRRNVYFSHLAVKGKSDGTMEVIANWGDFFTAACQQNLREEMQKEVSPLRDEWQMLAQLIQTDIFRAPGFVITIPATGCKQPELGEPLPQEIQQAVKRMHTDVAKAAIEIWQSTRQLHWREQHWRQLLKRYVVMHVD